MSWEARVAQSKEYVARVEADCFATSPEADNARERLFNKRNKEAQRFLDYLGVKEILEDVRTVWGEGEINRVENSIVLETGLTRVTAQEYAPGYRWPLRIGVRDQTTSLGVSLDMGKGRRRLTVSDLDRFPTGFIVDNDGNKRLPHEIEHLGDTIRAKGLDHLRYILHYATDYRGTLHTDRRQELDQLRSPDAPDRLNHAIVEMVEERRAMGALPGDMNRWHAAIKAQLPRIISGRYLSEGSHLEEEQLKASFGIAEQPRRLWLPGAFWLRGRNKPAA